MQINFTQSELDLIEADAKECKPYKSKPDRYNPFQLDILWLTIVNRTYSPFLKKEIQSTNDACEHAKYVVSVWIGEDKAEIRKNQNERYYNKKKQTFAESNSELIAAKANWQKAISDRKAALEQWDSYVAHLRHIYNELKLRSQNV